MTIVTFAALWIVGFLVITSYSGLVREISLPAVFTPAVGSLLGSTSLPACPFKPTLCSSSLRPFSCAVKCNGFIACARWREQYLILLLILGLWHRRRFLGQRVVVRPRAKSHPAITWVPRHLSPLTSDFIIQTSQIFRPNKLTPGDCILLVSSAASFLPS